MSLTKKKEISWDSIYSDIFERKERGTTFGYAKEKWQDFVQVVENGLQKGQDLDDTRFRSGISYIASQISNSNNQDAIQFVLRKSLSNIKPALKHLHERQSNISRSEKDAFRKGDREVRFFMSLMIETGFEQFDGLIKSLSDRHGNPSGMERHLWNSVQDGLFTIKDNSNPMGYLVSSLYRRATGFMRNSGRISHTIDDDNYSYHIEGDFSGKYRNEFMRDFFCIAEESKHVFTDNHYNSFLLNQFAGLKYKDVAKILDLPQGTVNPAIAAAKRKISELPKMKLLSDSVPGKEKSGESYISIYPELERERLYSSVSRRVDDLIAGKRVESTREITVPKAERSRRRRLGKEARKTDLARKIIISHNNGEIKLSPMEKKIAELYSTGQRLTEVADTLGKTKGNIGVHLFVPKINIRRGLQSLLIRRNLILQRRYWRRLKRVSWSLETQG